MEAVLVLLLGLSALASAHYEGYPFEHKNEGKYGAEHPYANYGPADTPAPEPEVLPVSPKTYTDFVDHPYLNYHGYYHGYYPGNLYGYNFAGYGHNHEYDYRAYPGFPVHLGQGQFHFLGAYKGHCDAAHDHGLYLADDVNSFVVCVYGRVHRFQCPKGTVNSSQDSFEHGHSYNLHQLCGVNTLAQ